MTGLRGQVTRWLGDRWRAWRIRARRAATPVVAWVKRALRGAANQVIAIRQRHTERLADDPDYARAVTTGATAVVATVVTHPVVVAMLTAGLTAMLTGLHTPPARSHDRFTDPGDYGLADDYDPDRAWHPARRGRPAWEIFGD